MQEYTLADVAAHNKREDLWIVIHGKGNKSPKYTALCSLHFSNKATNSL